MSNQYRQQLLADFNSRKNYDQGQFYAPIAQALIAYAKLQTGQKVLDVATGTGLVALAAAKIVGDTGQVIGIDISTGMLAQAQQKLTAERLKNVEFLEVDAEHLNFDKQSFDVILCSLAICYLNNIPLTLQQWYQILKPGGSLVFNAWAETAFPSSMLFRQVARQFGVEIPNPNEPLGTPERCYELLKQVGFLEIEIYSQQFGWYFTPNAQAAEALWKINSKNVFGYQVFQLPFEQLEECRAEYLRAIQALPITEKGAWCDAPIYFIFARK